MPPDRVTRKEMNDLTRRLDEQDDMLREILTSIKGNKSLGIRGIVTAQEEFMDQIKGMKTDLDALNQWKEEWMNYMRLATSKKLWRSLFYIVLAIGIIYMASKYGVDYVWGIIKQWGKI